MRCDECERLYLDQQKCPHWIIQRRKGIMFVSVNGRTTDAGQPFQRRRRSDRDHVAFGDRIATRADTLKHPIFKITTILKITTKLKGRLMLTFPRFRRSLRGIPAAAKPDDSTGVRGGISR
jgi:hypothetical protein